MAQPEDVAWLGARSSRAQGTDGDTQAGDRKDKGPTRELAFSTKKETTGAGAQADGTSALPRRACRSESSAPLIGAVSGAGAQADGTSALPGAVRGWHTRGYLPHFDGGCIPQFGTFRLADSFPAVRLETWREELEHLSQDRADRQIRKRTERYLDEGHGQAFLNRPGIPDMVESALLHFDGERYQMHAWVVMPNHVHVLFTPGDGQLLSRIVTSWKSFTAHEANRRLRRDGAFWAPDYYDRYIRDQEHFDRAATSIERNPVKAGLCAYPADWRFSSARARSF